MRIVVLIIACVSGLRSALVAGHAHHHHHDDEQHEVRADTDQIEKVEKVDVLTNCCHLLGYVHLIIKRISSNLISTHICRLRTNIARTCSITTTTTTIIIIIMCVV